MVESVFSDTFLHFNDVFFSFFFFYVFTFPIAPRTIIRESCLIHNLFGKFI